LITSDFLADSTPLFEEEKGEEEEEVVVQPCPHKYVREKF
jgi:hypothetical protein